MQIVIDIPEEAYKEVCGSYLSLKSKEKMRIAIRNGTPLPKGHGRLIDANAFQKTYCKESCGDRPCVDAMDRCIFIGDLLLAPTIIEADKAESEEV